MRLLGLGVAILIVVGACGGAHAPPPPIPNPLDNEITALWTQIRDWRREAHMDLDPTPQSVFEMRKRTAKEVSRVCPENHQVPQTCNDVCNLADAICDNAERICDLADQLGKADFYAQDKCASAKASCHEAKRRCCDCSGDTP